jgi:hypothetical protein
MYGTYWGKPAPSPEEKPTWTSYELAEYLDQYPQTVIRWCRRWFGGLEKGFNVGRRQGYEIPWQYVYVGRAYVLTEHDPLRRLILPVLLASPKDWVIVVDDVAETCYSKDQAVEKVRRFQHHAYLLYVGEYKERLDNGTR